MRAHMNYLAVLGEYDPKLENDIFEEKSLFQKDYVY